MAPACFAAILLVLLLGRGASAQHANMAADHPTATGGDSSDDAGQAIRRVQQITRDLGQEMRQFEADVDEAIARYDRGFVIGRRQVYAADADVGVVSGDFAQRRAAVRKLFVARIRAVPYPQGSAVLADVGRLQSLIAETGTRVDAVDDVIKHSLMTSVEELGQRKNGAWQARHELLIKTRRAALDAVRAAILVLPVDLPEAPSAEESKEMASDGFVPGTALSLGPGGGRRVMPREDSLEEPSTGAAELSLPRERNRRITLVREFGYRVSLVDPGREDAKGRRLFYQDEWVQRGVRLERRRWRVAVDPATGQHVLVKRYPLIQSSREDLEEVDAAWQRDYLWTIDPPEDSPEPARAEVQSALDDLVHSREQLLASLQGYRAEMKDALAQNDRLAAEADKARPDALLPAELRSKLFAIRGHLAAVPSISGAEDKVKDAVAGVEESIRALEAAAAWANRVTLTDPDLHTNLPAADWDALETQADTAINFAVRARQEANALLPPELPALQVRFPALDKDLIVRMIRRFPENAGAPDVHECVQEIWRFVRKVPGGKGKVERSASIVAIDRKTGAQSVVRSARLYYDARPNEVLEAIFDQYAGQSVF